jgi:NAD(P)-dependent dehydrogenase (short-subunit alcohol dehydrogenase family)
MNLEDRSAIITGASQGLGKAIATSFVQAGASVLLMARGEALLHEVRQELTPLATRPGQQILIMRGNVAEPESCNAVVRYAQEALPNLTVLVNNAGVYGPMGRIEKVDWQAWVEAVQINLFGSVLMCRAIIPLFRAHGYGKIINLSGGGATASLPCISAYAASKVAIVRLTETFAEELRDAHIDVNAIAPGALNTRLLEEVLVAGPEKVGQSFYDRSVEQRDKGGVPLKRGADLALFLASGASDGISGRLLSAVWDDWPHLPEKRQQLAQSEIYTLRRVMPADRGCQW